MNIRSILSLYICFFLSSLAWSADLQIIENPCHGFSGFPYKKYQAFAVDENGHIHKFKNQGSTSKVENNRSYASVLDFLVEKKIISADRVTRLCDQTPYVMKIIGVGEGVANGSTRPVEPPAKKEGLDKSSQQRQGSKKSPSKRANNDHLAWANPIMENSIESYWVGVQLAPQCRMNSFVKYIFDYSDTTSIEQLSLKEQLRKNMQWAHIQEVGKADSLVEECGAQANCLKQNVFTYKAARKHIFGNEDFGALKLVGKHYVVEDVYCGKQFGRGDFDQRYQDSGQIPGKYQIPFHQVVNLEHSWPQSKFNLVDHDKLQQKSDLHHIFATDSKLNSMRSNYPFAEVDVLNTVDSQHIAKSKSLKAHAAKQGCRFNTEVGPAKTIAGLNMNPTQTYFEPPDNHKGNVARALFYMSVRYDLEITEVEEHYLRKWHLEDPVDAAELTRHQATYQIQGNRNPFIDFPELVDQIENF